MQHKAKALFIAALVVISLFASVPGIAQAAPESALAVPGLTSPANGAQIAYTSQPFVFNWNPVAGATGYNFQIANNAGFSPLLINYKVTGDGWAPKTPLAAGTYYWRAQAVNSTEVGPWMPAMQVTIVASGTAPVAPTPAPSQPIAPVSPSPLATARPYAAFSAWNTPIGANPVIDPNSANMIALFKSTRNGGAISSDPTQYTYPVYWADASTPRRTVSCVVYGCAVYQNGSVSRVTSLSVPIPNGATQSSGTDAQMIVVDTVTGMEYGFYHASRRSDGNWQADNGYVYPISGDASAPRLGSRGAGIPYLAGLVRPWEIRQGHIDHAIAFAYEFTKAGKCVYPATKTDGKSSHQFALPEGARLQLNPALTNADFDRMGLNAAGKTIARALQQYGMILVDTGGSPKIMVENLAANPLTTDSWASLGVDQRTIWGIPYDQFRVLGLPAGYSNGSAPNWGTGCYK